MPQEMAPTIEAAKIERFFRSAVDEVTTLEFKEFCEYEKIGWSTAKRHRKQMQEEALIAQVRSGVYKWAG